MKPRWAGLMVLLVLQLDGSPALLAKSTSETMTEEAALSLLMNKQHMSSAKQVTLLVGPKQQKIDVRKKDIAFEVSAITCDQQSGLGYSVGMRALKAYKEIQFGMSKASSCVKYQFHGPGLNSEAMPILIVAFLNDVYGLKKDDQLSVSSR